MSVTYSATQMHGTEMAQLKKGIMAVSNPCIQWILWQTQLIQDMNYGSSIFLPRKDMLDAVHLTYNALNQAGLLERDHILGGHLKGGLVRS